MPASIVPNTGIYVVRDGAWVESTEPQFVSSTQEWRTTFEAVCQTGGEWKRAYLKPLPTTMTITSPPQPDLFVGVGTNSGTITGRIVDSLGRGVDATLTVTRILTNEAGSVETALPDITSDANGDWTVDYDFGVITVQDLNKTQRFRIAHAEALPYLASSVSTVVQPINSASVTLTITDQPSGSILAGATWGTGGSGRVAGTAIRQGGDPATGTIVVNYTGDNGADSMREAVPIQPDGSWETFGGPFGWLGVRTLQVIYEPLPGGFEDPTTLTGNTVQIGLATPSFSKGSVGETTIAMSCGSVSSASGYQFYEGGTQRYSGTSRSFTRSGLANYRTYYNWKARAYGYTPAGTAVYSSFTTEHDARTGRPEKRDASSVRMWVRCAATGSWRTASNNTWGQRGDKILQGAYSGYQSYGYYRGLIDFGHLGAQNQVKAAVGNVSARISNGWASEAIVHLFHTTGVGTSGGIKLRWAASNIAAGGDPGASTRGAWYEVWTGGAGSWGAYAFGNTNANELIRGGARSICCIYDSTASDRYGEFNGRSAGNDDCDIIVTWNWNYVTQTKVSGTWLN